MYLIFTPSVQKPRWGIHNSSGKAIISSSSARCTLAGNAVTAKFFPEADPCIIVTVTIRGRRRFPIRRRHYSRWPASVRELQAQLFQELTAHSADRLGGTQSRGDVDATKHSPRQGHFILLPEGAQMTQIRKQSYVLNVQGALTAILT